MQKKFNSWGYETKIETYHILFPYPKIRLLELTAPTTYKAKLTAVAVEGDDYTAQADALLPWLSVSQNITLGAKLRKEKINTVKLTALLKSVELTQAKNKLPAQLSGGMRQRTALARTLYEDKPIVLMDEPFSSLDIVTKLGLQDLSNQLLSGRTVFLVTHDPMEALRLADKIYVMTGSPATLKETLTLTTKKPRDPKDKTLLTQYTQLIAELYQAKGEMHENP